MGWVKCVGVDSIFDTITICARKNMEGIKECCYQSLYDVPRKERYFDSLGIAAISR